MNAPFPNPPPPARQPIFNLPGIIVAVLVVLVGIHAIREFVLSQDVDRQFVFAFAFVPIRETAPLLYDNVFPAGAARLWTFVTYALLHGDWAHVGFNAMWLAAFGSPLAWRFGPWRFVLFSAVGAAAGALLHLAFYPDSIVPMVGASAAISAHMAAAGRFVFASGGPMWRSGGAAAYRLPAAPLTEIIRDRRVMLFLGMWFGLNLLFGIGAVSDTITSGAIAWDAHIGGFLAGLLLFPLFDPIRTA